MSGDGRHARGCAPPRSESNGGLLEWDLQVSLVQMEEGIGKLRRSGLFWDRNDSHGLYSHGVCYC